jgi:hypothetical protein
VVGVLVEADFENLTARLRTLSGEKVAVTFDETKADAIQEALRRQAELVGEVHYDPKKLVATSVRLRELHRAEQLMFGSERENFWETVSVEGLAQLRGIGPVEYPERLQETRIPDDEVEAFLAALRR